MKFKEAIDIAEQVLNLAQSLYPSDHPDVATSLNNLALLYDSQDATRKLNLSTYTR
jgi:hypothetical protein